MLAAPAIGYFRYAAVLRTVKERGGLARLALYCTSGTLQWIEVTALLVWWGLAGRAFQILGFGWGGGWPAWAALAAAIAATFLYASQVRTVKASPEARQQVHEALTGVAGILPHNWDELRGFTARAVTAGVAEEIVWRGFLFWYLGNYLGYWPGAAVAVLVFGAAHAYQGVAGAAKAGFAGLVCGGLYVVSGSLVPAIILHVTVDVGSGVMAYYANLSAEADRKSELQVAKSE